METPLASDGKKLYMTYGEGPVGSTLAPPPNISANPKNGYETDTAIPYWPIIAVVIIGFISWTEFKSQNCTENCINKPPPIEADDTAKETIDKITIAIRNQHKMVSWRRSIVISIVLAIIIIVLINASSGYMWFPNGFTVLMVGSFLFLAYYFSASWFGAHWWRNIDKKIEDVLLELRNRDNNGNI